MRFFCQSLRGRQTQSEIIELEKKRPAGIPRKRYCKLMGLNRTTLYYKPKGESTENLKMMEMMDKYYLDHPTAGVLTMVNMLILAGLTVGTKRVRRLMRKMGLMVIYPQKCLSKGGKPEYFHPYLLRHLEIDHPNQVWSTDIS